MYDFKKKVLCFGKYLVFNENFLKITSKNILEIKENLSQSFLTKDQFVFRACLGVCGSFVPYSRLTGIDRAILEY